MATNPRSPSASASGPLCEPASSRSEGWLKLAEKTLGIGSSKVGGVMSESYWKFCYFGPDGEEICTELYAELEPHVDEVVKGQLKELGGLQEIVGQVADSALQVRLLEVLDETALRLNAGLPEGFVLRRADMADFADRAEFFGVPGV